MRNCIFILIDHVPLNRYQSVILNFVSAFYLAQLHLQDHRRPYDIDGTFFITPHLQALLILRVNQRIQSGLSKEKCLRETCLYNA